MGFCGSGRVLGFGSGLFVFCRFRDEEAGPTVPAPRRILRPRLQRSPGFLRARVPYAGVWCSRPRPAAGVAGGVGFPAAWDLDGADILRVGDVYDRIRADAVGPRVGDGASLRRDADEFIDDGEVDPLPLSLLADASP